MSTRLWYPQIDVVDTIRRMTGLMQVFDSPPGVERLCIADFFLANPPLLYRLSMPMDDRKKLMALDIVKPDKAFISYPASQLLFHKMEPTQKEAIISLKAKCLIDIESYKNGYMALNNDGLALLPLNSILSEQELLLADFLVSRIASNKNDDSYALRKKTGLRRSM